jgi:hypothetical protein
VKGRATLAPPTPDYSAVSLAELLRWLREHTRFGTHGELDPLAAEIQRRVTALLAGERR